MVTFDILPDGTVRFGIQGANQKNAKQESGATD